MIFGNDMVGNLGGGHGGGFPFEFVGEGDIIEECPRVVEFMVPCFFELLHSGKEVGELSITNKGEEGGIDSG